MADDDDDDDDDELSPEEAGRPHQITEGEWRELERSLEELIGRHQITEWEWRQLKRSLEIIDRRVTFLRSMVLVAVAALGAYLILGDAFSQLNKGWDALVPLEQVHLAVRLGVGLFLAVAAWGLWWLAWRLDRDEQPARMPRKASRRWWGRDRKRESK
jgi:hypothetical protein